MNINELYAIASTITANRGDLEARAITSYIMPVIEKGVDPASALQPAIFPYFNLILGLILSPISALVFGVAMVLGSLVGYYGEPVKPSIFSNMVVNKYQKRISGSQLDRVDIHVELPRVQCEKLSVLRYGGVEHHGAGQGGSGAEKAVCVVRTPKSGDFGVLYE